MTFACQWTDTTTGCPASTWHDTEAAALQAADQRVTAGARHAAVFEIEETHP